MDRLVYALLYDRNECPNSGPPPLPGSSAKPDEPLTIPCTTITWIDAGTGERLGTQSWGVDIDHATP